MNRAEPAFDIDLAYGKQGELLIGDFLKGVANGDGRVEVKRKRRIDFEFYVETHCDKGRKGIYQPSGINVTKAEAWAFVVANTNICLFLPTETLKQFLSHRSVKSKEEKEGACPTKGKLVNLVQLFAELDRQK